MRLVLRLVQAALGAAATAAVSLYAADRPRGFWAGRAWLFYLSVAVVAGAALLAPAAEALRERRSERRVAQARRVETILSAGFVQLVRALGVPFTEVGVHAYLVRRSWPPPWRRALVHVGGVRLVPRHPPSGLRWTKGKGVIGTCWGERKFVAADGGALAARAEASSPEEWEAIPAAERLGMSLEDIKRTESYGTIAAMPLFGEDGVVRGCVAADARPGLLDVVDSDDVRVLLANLAQAVWLVAHSSAVP